MLLLILSSYRMSDAESVKTVPYYLEPMDDNPGRESASASSHRGTPGSVRSRSHSPANHRKGCCRTAYGERVWLTRVAWRQT